MNCLAQRIVKKSKQNCAGYFGKLRGKASEEERSINEVIGEKDKQGGQARKSIRRMPWHWEPKKDVTSCEKLR